MDGWTKRPINQSSRHWSVLVRQDLPPFVGVLELPAGWNEVVFEMLIEDYGRQKLQEWQGTLGRHRGMLTLRDRLWQERRGSLVVPQTDRGSVGWRVLLPGDAPVGLGPGRLDRIELGIPEGVDAVVLSFHMAGGEAPSIAAIEALASAMEDLAERLGAGRGRADFAPRFLAGGCDWFWILDGPRRTALLPMHLDGPWGAFDPQDWPQPCTYDRLYGEQDLVVMAGFDAGMAGWTDEWLGLQPPGSLAFAYWQNRFAAAYNQAPRIPGTECRVSVRHRNVIIGRPVTTMQLRWHETGATPVDGAAAAAESMQRLLDAHGIAERAAIHVVAEVDDGD